MIRYGSCHGTCRHRFCGNAWIDGLEAAGRVAMISQGFMAFYMTGAPRICIATPLLIL
jgi:hypothetical protein